MPKARATRVYGPILKALLERGEVITVADLMSHPDQHAAIRRFRYGHVLGPGVGAASLTDWQACHPGISLAPDVVDLVRHVDGIHLWADLDRGRSYYGIRPLSEWVEVAASEWSFLFDTPKAGAFVLSYRNNGDYFLVLDTRENHFIWHDPQNFAGSQTVGRSVDQLLDWWWELTQELDPRRDAED